MVKDYDHSEIKKIFKEAEEKIRFLLDVAVDVKISGYVIQDFGKILEDLDSCEQMLLNSGIIRGDKKKK